MSLFDRIGALFARRRVDTPAEYPYTPAAAMASAGEFITQDTALRYSAVLACTRVIAETVASMPARIIRAEGKVKHEAEDLGQLYDVLTRSPNGYMSRYTFWEGALASMLLQGNFYAEKERSGGGQIYALHPIAPETVTPEFNGSTIQYKIGGKVHTRKTILHIPGFSAGGPVGRSLIMLLAEAIGHGKAADRYSGTVYKNQAQPGGVITSPGKIPPPERERIAKGWDALYSGANRGKIAVLSNGMDFKPYSMSPEATQLIESRKFSVEDIARGFRVPVYMIGQVEKGSYANFEQQSRDFFQTSLNPWLSRIETAITNQILYHETKDRRLAYRFDFSDLLRGDQKTRFEAYQIGLNNGFLSANEARAAEDMDPIEGGDVYRVPLHMGNAQEVTK